MHRATLGHIGQKSTKTLFSELSCTLSDGVSKGSDTMSKTQRASVAALVALVLFGVWVDITGYLDVFASPTSTGDVHEAAHYACYVGRIAAAVAFLTLPRVFNMSPNQSVPLVLVCMVAGTLLYSFGPHQALLGPLAVTVVGSTLIGIGHVWAVTAAYVYVMGVASKREAVLVAVAAQVAERIVVELIDSFMTGGVLIVASYVLPLVAGSVLVASNLRVMRYKGVQQEGQTGGPGTTVRRYYVVLSTMAGVGLVACGAMSTAGIWGNAGGGQYGGETASLLLAIVESALVVVLCRVTFMASAEKPLALRYQSSLLVLITGFALASSRQMLVALPDSLVNVLLVTIENYGHILFWIVAMDAAFNMGWPTYRALGVGLFACSVTGLVWSVFLEHELAAAESAVFIVFYLLIIVCVVYPQVFNRSNMRSSSDEGTINAFALEGECRLDAGVNGAALQTALEQRCAYVAGEHRLSEREGEVLVLLAKGVTRQNMYRELQLSEGTVKTHLVHIYKKLGIHSQSELLELVYKR